MGEILQQLVNGISLGAIFMIGAFSGYFVANAVSHILPTGSIGAVIVVFVAGFLNRGNKKNIPDSLLTRYRIV